MNKVLVLNVDMTPMGMATPSRALKMLCKGVATVVAETDIIIHPTMFMPSIIRLVKAVRHLWKKQVPWSKQNVHVRDGFICQYCGDKLQKKDCTVDHVVPKDQGGRNKWTNCVCACFNCNNIKDNRTPNQAHMTLLKQPYAPTIMEFIIQKVKMEGADELLKALL